MAKVKLVKTGLDKRRPIVTNRGTILAHFQARLSGLHSFRVLACRIHFLSLSTTFLTTSRLYVEGCSLPCHCGLFPVPPAAQSCECDSDFSSSGGKLLTVMLGRNNGVCAMQSTGCPSLRNPVDLVVIAALCVVGIGEAWGRQDSTTLKISAKNTWKEKASPMRLLSNKKSAVVLL